MSHTDFFQIFCSFLCQRMKRFLINFSLNWIVQIKKQFFFILHKYPILHMFKAVFLQNDFIPDSLKLDTCKILK